MICDNLNEIVNLQDIIKMDNLRYKLTTRKIYSFSECSLPIVSLRDIHLPLKHADEEQSIFAAKIKKLDKLK